MLEIGLKKELARVSMRLGREIQQNMNEMVAFKSMVKMAQYPALDTSPQSLR